MIGLGLLLVGWVLRDTSQRAWVEACGDIDVGQVGRLASYAGDGSAALEALGKLCVRKMGLKSEGSR